MNCKWLMVNGEWRMIVFVVVWLLLGVNSVAQEVGTFEVANQLVANGNVGEGLVLYESLVEQGIVDLALFYNLGNAYYAEGEIGRAIVNYQRALRIDPSDDDARHNLNIVREQVQAIGQDGDDVIGSFFFRFTRNQMAWAALGSMILVAALVAIYRLFWRGLLLGVIVAAMCAAFVSAVFFITVYRDTYQPDGVVVETAALRVEPAAESRTIFSLPSGTEITIQDEAGAWVNVSIVNNDIEGWMLADRVEQVEVK